MGCTSTPTCRYSATSRSCGICRSTGSKGHVHAPGRTPAAVEGFELVQARPTDELSCSSTARGCDWDVGDNRREDSTTRSTRTGSSCSSSASWINENEISDAIPPTVEPSRALRARRDEAPALHGRPRDSRGRTTRTHCERSGSPCTRRRTDSRRRPLARRSTTSRCARTHQAFTHAPVAGRSKVGGNGGREGSARSAGG